MIHRFWMGPPRSLLWSRAVIEQTQDDVVSDWTPATIPADARWVLDARHPRDVSNRLRYWLLLEMGGVWLDHDVIPLRAFPTDSWTAAVGQEREGSAMRLPAGHPMLEELVRICRVQPPLSSPVQLTGARLLTAVGRKHPDVRLEPRMLPYDAIGYPTGVTDPMAVHLWESSAAINLEVTRDQRRA